MKVIREREKERTIVCVWRKQNGQFTWHAKAAPERKRSLSLFLVCAPPKSTAQSSGLQTTVWWPERLHTHTADPSHTYISLAGLYIVKKRRFLCKARHDSSSVGELFGATSRTDGEFSISRMLQFCGTRRPSVEQILFSHTGGIAVERKGSPELALSLSKSTNSADNQAVR